MGDDWMMIKKASNVLALFFIVRPAEGPRRVDVGRSPMSAKSEDRINRLVRLRGTDRRMFSFGGRVG